MSYKNLRSVPVYRKSMELCSMSREIASFVSSNKDLVTLYKSNSLRDHIADSLLADSILIPQQIARAESSQSYSVRMKSISFINIMIRNMISYCNGLENDGLKEREYIELMRKEVRSFRRSFKKWRKSLGGLSGNATWGFNDYKGY